MIGLGRTGMTGVMAGAVLAILSPVLAGLQSCAHVASPPGGPPDSIPPLLVLVEPDSFSVVTDFRGNRGMVRFEFNEPISERSIPGSAMMYPFDLRPHTNKGKYDLKVRPRIGWVEDRIYHIRVEPVIQDYFNNRIERPILFVFSTGTPIPFNAVTGTVSDRITGQILPGGRIDLVHLPDTLRYGGIADSVGDFSVATLPEGEYLAIGYDDVNNNRRADAFDRSDTLPVTLGSVDTLVLEFQVFQHDTAGPVLSQVDVVDSTTLMLGFDGYLDPDAPIAIENVAIFSMPDSAPVAVETVMHYWQYLVYQDSIVQAERARRDSIAAAEAAEEVARDSAAAAAGDTLAAEAAEAEVAEPRPVRAGPRTVQPGDTLQQSEEPQALPDPRIVVITSAAIAPGSYDVSVARLLNLAGFVGGGEGSFEIETPEVEEEGEDDRPPGPSDEGAE